MKRIAWMAPLLCTAWLLGACTSGKNANKSPRQERVPVVAVTRPKLQMVGQNREYTGTVESLTQVAVVPQVAGQLESVLVSVGDPVSHNQVLATVDDSQLEAQVQQAQAQASAAQAGVQAALSNLASTRDQTGVLVQAVDQMKAQVLQSEAGVAKAETQLRLAEKNLSRVREVAAQDLIAQTVVDQNEAARESAQADLRSAEAQLKVSHRQLEQARLRAAGALEQEQAARSQVDSAQAQADSLQSALRAVEVRRNFTRVRSPIDGVVIARNLDPGAYVTPGSSTAVVLVASLEKLRVTFQLSEADLELIKPGQEVNILLDALQATPQRGKIQRLAGGLDPNTRTLRVEVQLIRPDSRLRPGMLARLKIQGAAREALTIPIQGVVTRQDKQYVYVVGEDEKVIRKEVTVASLEGDLAIILSGLEPSQAVIVRGIDQIQEGKAVKTMPVDKD